MGKKLPRLTLDEHREVANTLARIWKTFTDADALDVFWQNLELPNAAIKDIYKLQSKLSGLLFELHPGVAVSSIYFPWQVDPLPWDRVSHEMFAVGRVINGAVSAPIIDLYLRCERSTYDLLLYVDKVKSSGNGDFLRGFAPYSHEDDCSHYYSSGGCTCGASERERSDRAAEQVRRDRRKGASLEVPGA